MSDRRQCVNGHDVAIGDRTCPQCEGEVVSVRDAGPPTARRTAPGEQQTAWGWILVGFVLAVIGAALTVGLADEDADVLVFGGYVVMALGGVLTSIGVVAEGVRIGRNLSR